MIKGMGYKATNYDIFSKTLELGVRKARYIGGECIRDK